MAGHPAPPGASPALTRAAGMAIGPTLATTEARRLVQLLCPGAGRRADRPGDPVPAGDAELAAGLAHLGRLRPGAAAPITRTWLSPVTSPMIASFIMRLGRLVSKETSRLV